MQILIIHDILFYKISLFIGFWLLGVFVITTIETRN
uniref:Uncharacterized protein n=1 Tax=viral metagenome TaxID=1070528 RepID=A0A6C0EH23_9ZZZZ